MKILIAPYSARLFNAAPNPKNFPHFAEVVSTLTSEGYDIVQIGVSGEQRIAGVGAFVTNWPLRKIRELVDDAATWLSVDSWLPHYCYCERLKPGVVIFGPSDPRIFGHPQNINLLRSPSFLRPCQYASWTEWQYDPAAFVDARAVIDAVHQLAPPIPPEMLLTADLRGTRITT